MDNNQLNTTTPTIRNIKEFWDRRPCNIRHSPENIGSKRYFDQVEERKYFVEPHIKAFADFPHWKNKAVLEVGCGIGTDAINFARHGADYHGFELSEKSLEITRSRFKLFGLTGHFYSGNAEHLSDFVPPRKFDLIYSFGVIHHTPEPEKILAEIEKHMDENSQFRLMLYAKYSWKNLMIKLGFDQPEAQYGCPIANTYSFREIRNLLKDFEIMEIKKDHIFPYVINKYVKYDYEIVPWFRYLPKKLFRILEKKLGWHTLITCKLK